MEGEDKVLEVLAEWEELGRKTDNTEVEMGDVGRHELVKCKEVSLEEVVEVMKWLKRGKAAILTEL